MLNTSDLFRRIEEETADLMRIMGERFPIFADILESDEEIIVIMDLPGCVKQTIEIDYHPSPSLNGETGGELEVQARREKPLERGFRYVAESRPDFITGSVSIHHDVNYRESTATYEDGLLRVRLPKNQGTAT